MKIILTGGSGFLGRRVIPTLKAKGCEVVALVRSEKAASVVRGLGAVAIEGDLSARPPILPSADAVVHAAAHFQLAGPKKPFFQTNVEGARKLLSAAQNAGIGRFVFVSAAAVVMDDKGAVLDGVDESAPVFPASSSAYIASKTQAERLVLDANRPGFLTFALRPPGIWGAGDAFSKALPKMVNSGQFGFIDRGAYPYVTCHVDNVVEAISCAIEAVPAAAGRAYFINDSEPTTFREFVIGIARALGLDVAKAPSMPYPVARAIGAAMESGWSLLGRTDDPPFSRAMVRLIGRPFTTSDAAARRLLGYVGRIQRSGGLSAYA